MYNYNPNNIFSKILRKELLVEPIYEDKYCLSFYDINPRKKIHILVISKENFISFDDFMMNATDITILNFWKGVSNVINLLNISDTGYRIITNHGKDSGQEIPHFHIHILGGEYIGPLVISNT